MRLAVYLLVASAALAQNSRPDVTNARFEEKAYSGNLESQLHAGEATWFGYPVKSVRHDGNDCCGRCNLEESRNRDAVSGQSRRPIALEGTNMLAMLFRVENNAIEKIRVHSLDCPLDAGGLPFVWLDDVPAAASLSWMEHLATAGPDHLRDTAIFAISQHEGPEALTLLERLSSPPRPAHLRGQAIFWLAQRAGEKAASFITNAIQNDPDTEVKKRAVFALSQLPKEEGVPRLIQVARSNNNREIRKQAFFWLGQSQDPRALAFIEQVLAQ